MEKSLIGGPELLKALAALPDKMSRNFIRGGARAGAARLAKGAKERVRRKSGKTAKLIKIKSPRLRDGIVVSGVTTKGDDEYIARLLETGTAAHIIALRGAALGKNGRPLVSIRTLNRSGGGPKARKRHSLIIGGKFIGTAVMHPGARPFPFMRPTLDEDADAAVQAVLGYLSARFTKEGLDAPYTTIVDEIVGDDE